MRRPPLLSLGLAVGITLAPSLSRGDDDPDTEVARRLFREGGALYATGKYEGALAAFEKARRARPLPAFDYNIARCYDRLGRWPEALAAYERFVTTAADPADLPEAEARIAELGRRLESDAQRAAAEEHYKQAVAAFNAGQVAVAAEEFRRSYEAVRDPALLYRMAEAYRLAGDRASALRDYELFLREVPTSTLRASVEAHVASLKAAAATNETPRTSAPSATAPPKNRAAATPAPSPAATGSGAGPSDRIAAIADVVKGHRDGFRACFDRWSAAHPGTPSKVTLSFFLDPDGLLGQARATSTVEAPELTACVVAHARTLAWPASPSGKFTRFTYPFDFKPH